MADHPLRPATDHRLGRPLPHQLANRPQPPQQAPYRVPPKQLSSTGITPRPYAVLSPVSRGYSPPAGRLATCYAPGRHGPWLSRSFARTVRLTLVKHAASVHPEPGSNSPIKPNARPLGGQAVGQCLSPSSTEALNGSIEPVLINTDYCRAEIQAMGDPNPHAHSSPVKVPRVCGSDSSDAPPRVAGSKGHRSALGSAHMRERRGSIPCSAALARATRGDIPGVGHGRAHGRLSSRVVEGSGPAKPGNLRATRKVPTPAAKVAR